LKIVINIQLGQKRDASRRWFGVRTACRTLWRALLVTVVGFNHQLNAVEFAPETAPQVLTPPFLDVQIESGPEASSKESRLSVIRTRLAAGYVDDALLAARELVKAFPDYKQAIQILASAMVLKGEVQQAAVELNKACISDPKNAALMSQLGGVLILRNEIQRAREIFEEVSKFNPDYAPAFFGS